MTQGKSGGGGQGKKGGAAAGLKKVNPVVDAVLGGLLVAMIGFFCRHLVNHPDSTHTLAKLALGSCAVTLAGIVSVRHAAAVVGRWLSAGWRSSASIPEECRSPLAPAVAMKKWVDQAWQFVIHATMSVWEVRLLLQHPAWWADPRGIGCPGSYAISAELEAFFVLQFVLWAFTGVSCKWFEERRKDYVEMMAHHVLTVALILTAQLNGETAFGLVVLAVHDTSDVFLDLMKMANYLKVEGRHGFFITEICFVLNTYVAWPYLRLYVYPAFVISGQFLGYQDKCTGVDGYVTTAWDVRSVPLWITARTTGLSILFLLHVFWWYILNRIGFKLVMGQSGHTAGDEEYEISMKDKKKDKKKDKSA